MISAREDNIIFLKFSKNENFIELACIKRIKSRNHPLIADQEIPIFIHILIYPQLPYLAEAELGEGVVARP